MDYESEEMKHYRLEQALMHQARVFATGGYQTQDLPAGMNISDIPRHAQIISRASTAAIRQVLFKARHPDFQTAELVSVLALLSERTRNAFLLDNSVSVTQENSPQGDVTRLYPAGLYMTGTAASVAFNKSATADMIRPLIRVLADLCANSNEAVSEAAILIAAQVDIDHHGIWHSMYHSEFKDRMVACLRDTGITVDPQKHAWKIMDRIQSASGGMRMSESMKTLSEIPEAPALRVVA